MKTLIQITTILVLSFFLSCEKASELSEVEFTTNLTKTISFTADDTGSFSGSFILDLNENSDTAEYLDKLKSILINEANYTITAFNGNQELGGVLSILAQNQQFGPYTHVSFYQDVQNQTVYNLDDSNKLNTLAVTLLNDKQLEVQFTGDSTLSEIFTMSVKFNLNVTIKAQVL